MKITTQSTPKPVIRDTQPMKPRFCSRGLIVSLALTGLLTAQTGSFTNYGQGCPGTGKSTTCISHNAAGGVFAYRQLWVGQYAVRFQTNAAVNMSGFEFYTRTIGYRKNAIIITSVFAASSTGKPIGKPLASGTMTITNNALGWYKTTFATSVKLSANTYYFVSYHNFGSAQGAYAPVMASGSKIAHSWQATSSLPWTKPVASLAWAFKVNCSSSGGAVPNLSANSVPKIGKTLGFQLARAKPKTTAVLLIGGSMSKWGASNLPLNLTPAGAPGCSLLTSIDVFVIGPTLTSAQGALTLPIHIPNSGKLINASFYSQWLVIDPKASTLGIVFSKGGRITIGA